MRAIVFGATASAETIYEEIKKKYNIVAFVDNDASKQGEGMGGIPIVSPSNIESLFWDEIIIVSTSAMEAIKKQLLEMGIPERKINTRYVDLRVIPRRKFCEDFASVIYSKNIFGCIAEAGVFQGEFAAVMNENFPDRKLYLFDTFEGFDQRDVVIEEKHQYSDAKAGYLNITSEILVLNKMPHPENCIIKKGYFPKTTCGIDEKFCYVNLDMDLYKPTLEGLRFFYPLMVEGGIITIHDYFSQGYEGVNAALEEFMNEVQDNIVPFPIGDNVSIAIQRQ